MKLPGKTYIPSHELTPHWTHLQDHNGSVPLILLVVTGKLKLKKRTGQRQHLHYRGLCEFKVMPFGVCNAPVTFQRLLMDPVLAGLQWSHCLVYIDDVIVLGHDFENHLQNLQAVFQQLHQAGLKLKPIKCTFFQQEVQYLGKLLYKLSVIISESHKLLNSFY